MSESSTPKSWYEKLSEYLLREPQSKTELLHLLEDANTRELINFEALSMIKSILNFSTLLVSDVMVPRGQMITLDDDESVEKALDLVIESGHSRFPILNTTHDEVTGILLAKDLLTILKTKDAKTTLVKKLIRPVTFVPETKHLDALLHQFRADRTHMAITINEYGGIAGLITIEDVLEQIVGDITDETDIEEKPDIEDLGNQIYRVNALIEINDFNDYFKTSFPGSDFDTIAGLLCTHVGYLPKEGEHIIINQINFEVLSRTERHLITLKVTMPTKPSTPDAE